MAVEHAPKSKRGLFGAYPQIGVPVGMILATGLLYFLNTSMSKEDFAPGAGVCRSCSPSC